jgi:DNA repair exonuclease SbcCD ATPase subunit
MGLFSNNNQEVLGKLRQVMNEVLELRAEESARSTELIKQMDALNKRIDGLSTIVGTLDERQKSHTTMIELLGKKVNEIGKTVNDHFESFVKVSEKDTELFKLIAQALTGKVMEDEASAEPKLTEKAKKKRGRPRKVEDLNAVMIEGYVHANGKNGAVYLCKPFKKELERLGVTHMVEFHQDCKLFSLRFGNTGVGWKIVKGRLHNKDLATKLDEPKTQQEGLGCRKGSDFRSQLIVSNGKVLIVVSKDTENVENEK